MTTIYCPYTNKDIPVEQSNNEHIIPKSLGGINMFNLPVDADFNSAVGSSIDGDLANDFSVLLRRREFDARGHSRKSSFEDNGRPIQVELKGREGVKVWDAISRRELDEKDIIGRPIKSSFKMTRYGRAKFAAKVTLATGYFIYGDLFRNSVNHEEVRKLMNFSNESNKEEFNNISLTIYDEFMPTEKEQDIEQRNLDNHFCKFLNSSCVMILPGPSNIGFVVGILGQHVATLNVAANTNDFPLDGDYDLGHVIILKNNKIERISYRELAKRAIQEFRGDLQTVG